MFGLLVPLLLLIAWTVSLVAACCLDLSHCSVLIILGCIALRTFFQTGLFVTAHDAMHGAVSIAYPRLNHGIGHLCSFLYAFLPYSVLNTKHHLHHRHPATELDPDFCDRNIGQWYLQFMVSYLLPVENPQQAWILPIGMALLFSGLHQIGHIPLTNLLLFWVLPILFSSVQLFYFGTYLPHHAPGQLDQHRARSSSYSWVWSFLTCYHFGYHWEHHEYPDLPWYALPSVKRL